MSTKVINNVQYRILFARNSITSHHLGWITSTETLCGLIDTEFDTCHNPQIGCYECNNLAEASLAPTNEDVDGDWFPI